ncbi:hypothetical protein [Puniceicoccus vermicola]|uniref:Verru_Chthon cassette protein A n=1 Tax=Puniceicoccus vermicola TaxID=388746 RepID=A0A7X1AWM7_9BACT|nr:hypothetical protein [Puniceicoccus vermicola]MBC2600418.1 hypothetical protein [Puniceicoccus vermicola]
MITPNQSTTGRRSRTPNHGFALIIALSLMALIFLLLLSLAVPTRIGMENLSQAQTRNEARQNALCGLTIALGNLQKQLGVDQRTSGSPLFLDDSLAATAAPYHWTGIWDTKELNADGSNNPTYGENLGWLVSGYDAPNFADAIPTVANLLNPDGTPIDPNSTAVLVGQGSANSINDFVAAPKVTIGNTGEYAYWVGDEGRKAMTTLSGRAERGENPYPGNSPNVRTRSLLSAPAHNGVNVLTGLETLQPGNDPALANDVWKSRSSDEMILAGIRLNNDDLWEEPFQDFYHDISFNSHTLQTNTRDGGLKKDLSLLFELSDADFARTPYSGNSTDPAFSDWISTPPTDGASYIDPVTNDQVSYLFKEEALRYGANSGAYVRGPTWDYLRNFYRLYKDIEDNDTSPSIPMRPFRPSALDFSTEGGDRGYMWTMEADGGGDFETTGEADTFVSTVVQPKGYNHQDPVTRLTRPSVIPLVNRIIYVFSLYEDQSVDKYRYVPEGQFNKDGDAAKEGGEFEKTGGTTDAISLVLEPVVILWNPYNVAVEFNGGIRIENQSNFGFLFSLAPPDIAANGKRLPFEKENLDRVQMAGQLSAFANIGGGNLTNLQFILGRDETIRMEPGEVLYFSDPNSSPTPWASLPRSPKETYTLPTILLERGFNKAGGVILGRRTETTNNWKTEGLIHQIPADSTDPFQLDFYPWGGFSLANGGTNRRDAKETKIETTISYIPESGLPTYGHITNTDTPIQRNYLKLRGPKESGNIAPIRNWLYGQSGTAGPFPLLIYPEEIGSNPNRKLPFLSYGVYQNPILPDLNVVDSPTEFIGSMSPFAVHVDSQFSHGIKTPPYTAQMAPMSNYSSFDNLGDQGFFGNGYSAGSENHVTVSEIPTYPLQSLASLQHANVSPTAYMPGQAIGNSWASGSFGLDETMTSALPQPRYTIYDISYFSNQALFDDYFFSSLTPEMDLEGDTTQILDLTTTLENLVDDANSNNHTLRLNNERFSYIDDSPGIATSLVGDLDAVDGFSKTAKYFGLEGGFNVNSLSVDAWDAFLASTQGIDYTYNDPGRGYSTENNTETIFPRTTLPNGTDRDSWRGPRALSNAERRSLASAIVNEIRERGPFLSVSDFVNREISTNDNAKKGAIQDAIDCTSLNNTIDSEKAYTDVESYFQTGNITAETKVGIPEYLTQADVLTPIAPYLSARSDTFVVRSYGNSTNPITGIVDSEAVIEAVVQRIPDYVNQNNDAAETQIPNLSNPTNINFGRQFVVVSARWLEKDEI